MTYIIVDTANTFFRARHVVQGSADIKLGMAFHITFNSIKKAWQDFGGTHVVFCLEGRSWRKDFYEPYKRNRQEVRSATTCAEVMEGVSLGSGRFGRLILCAKNMAGRAFNFFTVKPVAL